MAPARAVDDQGGEEPHAPRSLAHARDRMPGAAGSLMRRFYPTISSRATARPDGHQIVVGDRTDIPRVQCEERRSPAGRGHELDFERIGLVDLDDRAEIPLA